MGGQMGAHLEPRERQRTTDRPLALEQTAHTDYAAVIMIKLQTRTLEAVMPYRVILLSCAFLLVLISPTGCTNHDQPRVDGEVVHLRGLTWQRAAAPQKMDWQSASQYCRELTLQDHVDWRLPTVDELRSAIRGCENTSYGGRCELSDPCPSCYSSAFCTRCSSQRSRGEIDCRWPKGFAGVCDVYWSSMSAMEYRLSRDRECLQDCEPASNHLDRWYSEPDKDGSLGAVWSINFKNGQLDDMDLRISQYYARCVRGRLLDQNGKPRVQPPVLGMYPATIQDRTDVVRAWLAPEVGFNLDQTGQWLLHVAAKHGHVEVAKILLEHGAQVNRKNELGRVPLHSAAASGHLKVV